MKISIIMPTRNRAWLLKENLKQLVNMDDFYEIVVVDDASNDDTYDVLRRNQGSSNLRIKYCRLDQRSGSPTARNVGTSLAEGDILLLIDDDIFIQNGVFRILEKDFQLYKEVGVIGGKVLEKNHLIIDKPFYIKHGDLLSRITGFIFIDIGTSKRKAEFVPMPFAVRKEAAKLVKFDEAYKETGYREESDYQQTVKEKGWKCLFDPDFISYHCRQEQGGNRGQIMKRRIYWKAKNHGYYVKKHFSGSKLLWYLLMSMLILIAYKPRYFLRVLQGTHDGLKTVS